MGEARLIAPAQTHAHSRWHVAGRRDVIIPFDMHAGE